MEILVIGGYVSKYALKRAEAMISPEDTDPIKRTREPPDPQVGNHV